MLAGAKNLLTSCESSQDLAPELQVQAKMPVYVAPMLDGGCIERFARCDPVPCLCSKENETERGRIRDIATILCLAFGEKFSLHT